MGWFVYIILCTDDTLYTGITRDIDRRLAQHAGPRGAKYFRGRRPLRVVYVEGGHSRSSALMREAAIKRMRRGVKSLLIASERNEVNAPRPG